MKERCFVWALAATLMIAGVVSGGSVELTIAEEGEARQAVIVSSEASERTREAAAELADYLGRMTGASFEVRTGDGRTGLAVGVEGDFPESDHDVHLATEDPFRRDDYMLRTHAEGAYLIGAGEMAVHMAVWDFLHHLGYRLYFPTDTWEVIPWQENLTVAIDTVERPDYVVRRAPRGSPWSDPELWNRWRLRNRVNSSFNLETGHAYLRILRDNREAFEANPEYLALTDGKRQETDWKTKFCLSNEALRELVVDWAVQKIENEPDRDSISMDPSDGSEWCQCGPCAEMGSVSDRVLTLANEVAEAINNLGHGTKYVGIYAYNQHSPPPSIDVHPNVVVSIATRFIRGGYTVEELIEGWRARGATLGIREYHDVFHWSYDRPRQARGGDLDYLARMIPYFHEQGARFMNSEARDSWGANGLGYWITPQLLWDLDNVRRIDELVEDFLGNAFGSAKEPMRAFYELLSFDHDAPLSDQELIGRMYRYIHDARQLADTPAVHDRLDDLILYIHYLELYQDLRAAEGEARQAAYERIWRYAYRIRDRMMLSTAEIIRSDRQYRDDSLEVPAEANRRIPEADNPWKSSEPFSDDEIAQILHAGLEAND